jgi:MFS family permease
VRPIPLPEFLADIVSDVRARDALIAGSVALFAAGLDPKVLGPAISSVQAAIRDQPEIETLVLVFAVAWSGLLLLGGAIGDTRPARPILLAALAVEAVSAAVGMVFPDGPLFITCRVVGTAAAALIIPIALATVAVSYHGVARATAIGLAYGAYGGAGALGPILLQVVPGSTWPAFAAAMLAAGLALWVARPRVPDLPRPSGAERPYVIGTAIWGLGIVAVTTGVIWFGRLDNPARWALIAVGAAILGGAFVYERGRRRSHLPAVEIERRPIAIAIFVGVVIAMTQTVPMLQLPLFFQLVLRYGPLWGLVAVAPLFGALVVAGPVAGLLLARLSPRTLVGAGVVAVGLGNLAIALLVRPGAGYLGFVVPCLLVGAGFVIATTVRTAIIFASVPRGLPATAAAINEASIAVGSRVGVVVVTAVVASVALSTYTDSVAGQAGGAAAIEAFRDVLTAIGTPAFNQVVGAITPGDVAPYLDAYAAGIRTAFVFGGVIAIVGGLVAWLTLGPRDPLVTVYEHRDERAAGGAVSEGSVPVPRRP